MENRVYSAVHRVAIMFNLGFIPRAIREKETGQKKHSRSLRAEDAFHKLRKNMLRMQINPITISPPPIT